MLSTTAEDSIAEPKVWSHDYPGIQVADMMTGAVAASHRLFLNPATSFNPGKRLAIARMASVLG